MHRVWGLSALLVACSSQQPNTGGSNTAASSVSTSAPRKPVVPTFGAPSAAGPQPAPPVVAEPTPTPTFDEVANVLFADRANVSTATSGCPASVPPDARVRCLFDERYRGDPKAASLAHELLVRWQIIAGVEVAHTMDGGYRGMIRIEPALPIAAERKHIEWIVTAMRDFDAFFAELDKRAASTSTTTSSAIPAPKRYRFRPITLRFMRSVAARTPSAYAHDWTVAWNLAGSLHTSADAVRETLFHEIFHLNDYVHPVPGAEAWSFTALNGPFAAVVKKCGTAIPCLGPYTPNDTIVRGGTYYSFQPGNGVREYAAELALRYYREQRAVFQSLGAGSKTPFKCGPPENVRAWNAMRDEFFAGVDAVPACG
jgi:hypothetical protein